ncbi:MAG: M14 family metallopeptidase [Planctomycetota bacterium]
MFAILLTLVAVQAAPDDQNLAPISVEAHRAVAGEGPWPLTVAESSDFVRSSRFDEVEAFLAELERLPAGDRLYTEVIGKTAEGLDVVAVTVTAAQTERGEPIRGNVANVVVNANIHGGEIEGKVATQILLRELALGYHADLLDELAIAFIPVFNVDGNDRISRRNRVSQNGPERGVGERPNALGLDLNRDFVKLESPEVQALTWLVGRLDPIAFFDLHTTNGSAHGYDLTYSPSLSPNANPLLDEYARATLFPGVRAELAERAGISVFDYGNFSYPPREPGSRGERGDPIAWSTYDSRPRFGTNLMGLRDCVSILSEAYSYLPYDRRVAATYAFVLECLRGIARDRAEIERRIASSRAARMADGGAPAWTLGVDCELAPGDSVPVRVGRIETTVVDVDPDAEGVQEGRRRSAAGPVRDVSMEVRSSFRATREVPVGAAFVVFDPTPKVIRALQIHLGAWPIRSDTSMTVEVRRFLIEEARRADRPFQGHREMTVTGAWRTETTEVPTGALIVPCTPLTAHLLHPESDDSLTTWNYFDDQLTAGAPHPVAISDVIFPSDEDDR